MRLFLVLLILFYAGLSSLAQSSQEDLERGLQEMERRGELRRNGSQLIFLKQRPADTALMREVYQKMFEKIDNPYQISFELDPKYVKGKQQLPRNVKPTGTNNTLVNVPAPVSAITDKISLPEGRYVIQLSNGRVLEAESNTYKNNGARVQIWLPYYALNQLWDLKKAGEGKYHLINVASAKALKVNTTTGTGNGTPVQLWPQQSTSEETKWIIQPAGNQKYTIRSAASGNNNKVLDVTGARIDRGGAAIQLWDNLNGTNQIWSFVKSYDSAVVRENFVDLRLNQSALKHQAPVRERGSCTFFGNIAALEAAYKKRGYGELDLSEEFFATMAKVMYIHPYWNEIAGSNYRENQLGGLQGGGSISWFTTGLKIPLERDMPFKEIFDIPPYWDTRDQRLANDFNMGLLTSSILKAPLYYGALTDIRLTEEQKRNSADYERILNLGYEIDVDLNIAHNYLVVGYDKTNPARPVFIVKDSYERRGTRCLSNCDTISYNRLMSRVDAAGYITGIREPSAFPELAFMGRWKLNFDGHKGSLDIYHIPGITSPALLTANGGSVLADKRIGVFYDDNGNAFRVNGKIEGKKIEFYFDLATPNQRWDELKGRKFIYYIDTSLDIMSGFHTDADGKSYGGYATKGAYISHPAAEPYLDRFINTEWNLQWGQLSGIIRCRVGEDASIVNGTFTSGSIRLPVTLHYALLNRSMINITLDDKRANVKFLNHEKGMLCGNSIGDQQIVLLYKH